MKYIAHSTEELSEFILIHNDYKLYINKYTKSLI